MLRESGFRCDITGVSPTYTRAAAEALTSDDYLTLWKSGFKMNILRESESGDELEFEMIGVEAPIANAIRRILLAEVPTVAIEKVYYTTNQSIVQDEVLAHRLGLLPLNIDPRLVTSAPGPPEDPDNGPTDWNTYVFRLKATGEATPSTLASHEGEGDTLVSPYTIVYARELVWDPKGDQEERLPRPAAVVNGDIVLAKLAPGQSIELEAHAVKGIGKDHAKFSPVATASYKLHTTITFPEGPFVGEDAEKLVAACPMKVFDIEDIGGKASKGKSKEKRAYVKDARACTVCRECMRPAGWNSRVSLERVSNHFIFSVESTGALKSRELVAEAFKILAEKARGLLEFLGGGQGGGGGGGGVGGGTIPVLSSAQHKARNLNATMRESVADEE